MGGAFRPQGRGEEGLDCLGLALRALAAGGCRVDMPRLPMRGHSVEQVHGWLCAAGFARLEVEEASPGDLLLSFPATRQAHLAVRTAEGFVEANAQLRRVVERPWGGGGVWDSAWCIGAGAVKGRG
nr:peptidoglycan endopeptidase [Sandaracinobacteroides sayramensis]